MIMDFFLDVDASFVADHTSFHVESQLYLICMINVER